MEQSRDESGPGPVDPGGGRAVALRGLRRTRHRDKADLDITRLRDESREDLDNLPAQEVVARGIVEDLTGALSEFEAVPRCWRHPQTMPGRPMVHGSPRESTTQPSSWRRC